MFMKVDPNTERKELQSESGIPIEKSVCYFIGCTYLFQRTIAFLKVCTESPRVVRTGMNDFQSRAD